LLSDVWTEEDRLILEQIEQDRRGAGWREVAE
jgi:hypothetical protein